MITNPTQFCKLVEGRLGWLPPKGPEFRRYQGMARRITEKVESNPQLYTWRNLELAVELLAREKQSRNPLGVLAHVPRAVAKAVEPEDDVEVQIREATAYEQHRGDPAGWVTRFARATGAYRLEALNEWKETVR